MELANGLAHLFSNQLEISDIEEQRKLVKDAEIKALQAQINPHFLFNAINTIISYTRTSPETASKLLVKLADFYRTNINPGAGNVSLSTELDHCKAYIAIESARFEERIRVCYDVENDISNVRLPPLILQPLIENALKHGILPLEDGGDVIITARLLGGLVYIEVRDSGIGIPQELLCKLFDDDYQHSDHLGAGIALKNVNARLIALYGPEHALKVESEAGKGTTVSFQVPYTL
jgi:two-component system sensor histidine kinase LytS